MTLNSGKIDKVSTDTVTNEVVLYEAETAVNISYMQFVSEHTTNILINVFIISATSQTRILPKDTAVSSSDILQFNVNYDLEPTDRIVATVSVANKISYVITGSAQ